MSLKLFHGLINIGDILTETYYRKSRASDEAKQELGLDPAQDYDASIGIASIPEYVVMSAKEVSKNEKIHFDLARFEQPLVLKSLFIDNANADSIIFKVQVPISDRGEAVNYVDILTQTFNRNKTPVAFPDAPLPPHVRLEVTAKTDIQYMQLAFVPCSILDSVDVTESLTN